MSLIFKKNFIFLLLLTAFSCKKTSSQSSLQDNHLGPLRNQGACGSCWIYSAATTLNSTLMRMNLRLTLKDMGLDIGSPTGFALTNDHGAPLSLNEYYQRYIHNKGAFPHDFLSTFFFIYHSQANHAQSEEYYPRTKLPFPINQSPDGIFAYASKNNNALHTPLISIGALVYGHYIKAFADYSNLWWPRAYDADGGRANDFNLLLGYAAYPIRIFPDVDMVDVESNLSKAICAGEPNCRYTSINDLINTAKVHTLSPEGQQRFFESTVEKMLAIPQQFRTQVKNGKMRYPIFQDDFSFSFQGKTYNRANFTQALRLPADFEMVTWSTMIQGSKASDRQSFKRRWQKSNFSYLNDKEMTELVAVLSILHQPVGVALENFSVDRQGNWIKISSSTFHALTSLGYFINNGDLVLKLRNTWGKIATNVNAFGMNKDWEVEFPSFILDQLADIFRIVHSKKCESINSELRAVGAAYLYLKRDGYSNFSELGKSMLNYLENCGGVVRY